MASSSLTCISSILDDLQLLEKRCPDCPHSQFRTLKVVLRMFRLFLMCARKWGNNNDASLGALLVGLEAAISKTGQKIRSFCLTHSELQDGVSDDDLEYKMVDDLADDCLEDFTSAEEIKEWYMVFSYRSLTQYSDSLVKSDDLMEFLESLLETFREPLLVGGLKFQGAAEPTQALEEKLAFFKNFICFVTLHGIKDDRLGPLLTHAESAAVNAACLYFRWIVDAGEELYTSVRNDTLGWLQNIIPVESQVHETCFQALIDSKLSAQSYREADTHILREFLDSLLCNIWWILKSATWHWISMKYELQMISDGLRSLRTILKEKPKKIIEEMGDVSRIVICDAGLVFLTLSLNAMNDGWVNEMDLVPSDLLERIKLIKATVAEKHPATSPFNFPRADELGFIDSLLKYMMDLKSPQAGTAALAGHKVQTIQEELEFFPSFLGKIVELRNEDEELQSLWDRVVDVAYRVEFLMDSLIVGDVLDSSSMSFDTIVEEIKIIKSEALKISDCKRLDIKVSEVTRRLNHMPSPRSEPIINDVAVGIEDEAAAIINRLRRGSDQVQIVPIVGMPGLGKTTLAKKVYNHPSVASHFYKRAWCTVSQVYHNKNLLLEILICIDSKHPGQIFEKSEEDLALEVKQRLQNNRYLIVLDDVWDIEAWKGLEATFPENRNGSRVILTSRNRDITAPLGKQDAGPHFLRLLTLDESWDLLMKKAFPGKSSPPPELCELRRQILEMCQGLPLTIIILAGILANPGKCGWIQLVESLSSSTISSTDQCTATLELSYKNLPDHLKPCFLYFGAFPEDHEHSPKRLTWLWVADGFVQKAQSKSSEDVANGYLMDLISRSLVIVSKQSSAGRVKACRIHDLVHDFCMRKAKEDNFMQLARGYDEMYTFNMQHNLRRLCIHSQPDHFCKSRLFAPTIRSLLFFSHGERYNGTVLDMWFSFGVFKLVRVLDLSQIYLSYAFPEELSLLVQLRFLAVRIQWEIIAPSIGKFSNLETFIALTESDVISLPDTIWNLKKLRHLQIKDIYGCLSFFKWPTKILDDAVLLCDLDTLGNAVFYSREEMEKVLRKSPNVRKLKCTLDLLPGEDSAWCPPAKILALDFLSRLESLTLKSMIGDYLPEAFEFQYPLTIKKLTLSTFRFPWSKISTIEDLPNLEVLKLLNEAFEGEIWSMGEKGFSKVSFLKLSRMYMVKWTAPEGQDCFPSLRKLVLDDCFYLEEIPSFLGKSTIETIEVSDCPYSASFIDPLQEEQTDMGNADLKILISSKNVDP